MDRIFYTSDGRLYKAKERQDASHAEMNFPPQDVLRALNEKPCTREEMIGRINHPEFNMTVSAVQAPEEQK